jgi:ADP-ribosyltransferase exoenzyme
MTTAILIASTSVIDAEILLNSLSLEHATLKSLYNRGIQRGIKYAAIWVYTQQYYIGCNRALRSGLYPEMAQIVDKELNDMTPTPGIAYRGQSRRSFEKCLIRKDGKVFFQDKGYLSSSVSFEVALDFASTGGTKDRVLLKLYGPGYNISQYSDYPSEQEILWRHHAMFEIFREEVNEGITIYHLRKT